MTHYHFTGAYPRVLTGLIQGVNAGVLVNPAPYGSTIEALPGDIIRTNEPYEHSELKELPVEPSDAHGLSPEDEAWAQANPQPVPAPEAPASEPDEEPDTMTAEGAPAPAEPTA